MAQDKGDSGNGAEFKAAAVEFGAEPAVLAGALGEGVAEVTVTSVSGGEEVMTIKVGPSLLPAVNNPEATVYDVRDWDGVQVVLMGALRVTIEAVETSKAGEGDIGGKDGLNAKH